MRVRSPAESASRRPWPVWVCDVFWRFANSESGTGASNFFCLPERASARGATGSGETCEPRVEKMLVAERSHLRGPVIESPPIGIGSESARPWREGSMPVEPPRIWAAARAASSGHSAARGTNRRTTSSVLPIWCWCGRWTKWMPSFSSHCTGGSAPISTNVPSFG